LNPRHFFLQASSLKVLDGYPIWKRRVVGDIGIFTSILFYAIE
jgi:hypothetical protein